MSVVTIRRASLKDLDELYTIEVECFGNEAFSKRKIEQSIKSSDFINLVAVSNGQPAGFIIGYIETLKDKNQGHIYTLDVKPKYRQKGIGFGLLEAAERFFVQNGVDSCHLEVKADNMPARRLYMKHGYRISAFLKNYYGLGADGLRLAKDLGTNA